MTLITDDTGTRWVEIPRKAARKTPRALKFENLKIGDQLFQKPNGGWYRKLPIYHLVTDMWFDPVAGQTDPVKGQMIGLVQIDAAGEPRGLKSSTTIRGLASQQFDYADIDYIAMCKTRKEAFASGDVIGIGAAKAIRARPKISGL